MPIKVILMLSFKTLIRRWGGNGVLATLNAQISQVDSQIHNDEIGMITSGAGIAGAIFTIFIAAFLDVFTAGAATGINIGASCALVTSVIGKVTAAGLYANALNTKQGGNLDIENHCTLRIIFNHFHFTESFLGPAWKAGLPRKNRLLIQITQLTRNFFKLN